MSQPDQTGSERLVEYAGQCVMYALEARITFDSPHLDVHELTHNALTIAEEVSRRSNRVLTPRQAVSLALTWGDYYV